MSFTACGAGSIQLNPGEAVLPATSYATWSRSYAGGAFASAAFIELHYESGNHAMWTFIVPAGFSNQPTLQVWGERGDGDDEWEASVRCVKPNNAEDWTNGAFDSANTGTWLAPGVSGLNLMQIPLSNNAGWEDGELCQLDLLLSAGGATAKVYYLEIE